MSLYVELVAAAVASVAVTLAWCGIGELIDRRRRRTR